MTRSRSNAAHADDKRFPVRVRVAVPEGGFGTEYPKFVAYLDRACGKGGWAIHPAYRSAFPQDAVFFYFADPSVAPLFLEMFGLAALEVAEQRHGRASVARQRP